MAMATARAETMQNPKFAQPKPMQNAVALAYLAGQSAPKVVAKGGGLIAEAIIERAREHGVFVHESKELVSLLMQVDLDEQIPPALYRAVAELLAWLYRIENMQSQEQ
jgi:flagellar biosynthesis protein